MTTVNKVNPDGGNHCHRSRHSDGLSDRVVRAAFTEGIGTNTQRTSAPDRGNMSDEDSTALKELVLF